MKESLEAFVQSETLDGVQCDHCQKKCTTLKRQVLHTLPNTIFFHLKRFELNFETFRHEKSNQRFEFPQSLNLEPYTKEGILDEKKDDEEEITNINTKPKEYYEYELSGIVVHTGSAEAGHYYSYIKDRVNAEWNEFNDSLIKSFDLKYLDNDCYGGKKKVKSSANWGGDWEHDQDKIKNAYILVYDRKTYLDPIHDDDKKDNGDDDEKKKQPSTNNEEKKEEQDNK